MAVFNLEKAGFTLPLLRRFRVCAESKTFSEAAPKIGVKHGEFSKIISSLEVLLGIEVFEKKDTPIKNLRSTDLTLNGQKLYEEFCSLDKIIRTDLHPQITLYSLKALKASSESKTFTEVAKKLNAYPSGVNTSLKHLEKDLGMNLFERTPKTTKAKGGIKTTQLTLEGQKLLKAFCRFEDAIRFLSKGKTI